MSFIDFNLQLTPRTFFKWTLLKGISVLYLVLVQLWLLAYRFGIKQSRSIDTPVLSVGNITTGGTGKTPMVSWIMDHCELRKIKVAVLTRGYGAKPKAAFQILNSDTAAHGDSGVFGDEPWMLFHNHRKSAIYISADRFFAAGQASIEHDLLVLDDGMQHLKLERDLNIVLIDASTGIGNGQIIPLGPLREPLRSLKRADAIIYTKTNLADPASTMTLVRPYLADGVPQFNSEYKPVGLIPFENQAGIKLEEIQGKKCFLISGIGNPASFADVVSQAGGFVVGHEILPDHHRYEESSIKEIVAISADVTYDFLICTEKDWVKLEVWRDQLPKGWYLKMEMVIDPGFQFLLDSWINDHLA